MPNAISESKDAMGRWENNRAPPLTELHFSEKHWAMTIQSSDISRKQLGDKE